MVRRKWEYMKYWWNDVRKERMWQDLDDHNIKSYEYIEDAGFDGWELIQVLEQKNGTRIYFFKREVLEEK
jgi:hypothetical protein